MNRPPPIIGPLHVYSCHRTSGDHQLMLGLVLSAITQYNLYPSIIGWDFIFIALSTDLIVIALQLNY